MAQVTFPYTLTAGDAENVNQLNSNLNALALSVNTVDTVQLSTSKPITVSTLASDTLDVLTPVGSLTDWAGAGDPTPASGTIKWLLADGRALSRTTYSVLYAAVSTTYGVGDGVTTFNLPDFRGRVSAGPDTMGTAQGAASRMASNNTRGAVGGAETLTLVAGNVPQVTADTTTPALTFTGTAGTTADDVAPNGGVGVRQWVTGDAYTYYFSYAYATNPSYAPNGASAQINAYKPHTHTITPAGTISGSGHTHTLGSVSPTAVNKAQPYQVVNKIIRVA